MTDRLFTAVLTFMLLGGGTVAVGSALFGFDRPAHAARLEAAVVELPRVEITGRRPAVAVAVAIASLAHAMPVPSNVE